MQAEIVPEEGLQRAGPIVAPGQTYDSVTDIIGRQVAARRTILWWLCFGLAFSLVMVLFFSIAYLFTVGVGIWGVNVPIAWGFAITNFVWWIGIGHAGTLISAILLLLHQEWRTSINRFAEAMTLFAVANAAIFPILHLGRPGYFYFLFPYPNSMKLWPQFRSPLVWDCFAVATYAIVSLLFWYIGIIPDLATLRDEERPPLQRFVFGVLALGWRGSSLHWKRYKTLYLLLAGLATPLVVSVHSVVSLDFAVAIVPGWHSTMFPPYFVAGAVYSGFAMVLTLSIPLRAYFKLEEIITMRHLENMAKVMLATGLMVAYSYLVEHFMTEFSGNQFEQYMIHNRLTGPYGPIYWLTLFCNILAPQVLWWRKMRTNLVVLFIMSLIVNTGMWLERFIIVVTSLHRDFMPSAWDMYYPTLWDWATFIGTIGLFFALFYLFVRFLPVSSMTEMRELLHRQATGELMGGEK